MPESFIQKLEAPAPYKSESENEPQEVEEFFDKEAEILAAYGMRGDIVLERGHNGWQFDFERRKLIYDPNFFRERGYSLKETLFATTHELMAHYGELLRDPELILREAERYTRGSTRRKMSHLHLLYNIFEDALGNRRIVAELPFLEETRTALYKEKLFPQTDYRQQPSHVQFVYGFLREAMVRGDPVELGERAREALGRLRAFGKNKIDILDLVTTPTIDPKDRFRIMRTVIEPIYLELYRKDVEEERNRPEGKKDSGKGEKADSGKERREGAGRKAPSEREIREAIEKKFKEAYRAYEESHPEPLSPEEEKKIREVLKDIAGKRGGAPSLDRTLIEQWAKEHGVEPEDVLQYRREFEEIAPLVAELREVFKKIVARRAKERWKLSPQLKKEGEELEEGALVESYIESKAGGEARAFRDFERRKREEVTYGALDMTIVADLSGSMTEGGKLGMQRKSAQLFLEALADFQREIEEAEYESGVSLGFTVRTEARAFGDFGDAELKALSPDLTEKERISIWKKIHTASGGTPDYLSLEVISGSITPEYEKELQDKTRRKVVVVLSDGASQEQGRYQKAFEALQKRGVIMVDLGMLTSERPEAQVISDIKTLPKSVQEVILKHTRDL